MHEKPKFSEALAALGGDLNPMLGEVRVAAAVADRDGIIRWQNERWTELAGDCVGRPLAEHVAPESSHEWRREFTKKVIGTARTSDYQINMIDPDGTHIPIDVSSVVVEGSDHRVVGVFGLVEPVAQGFKPPKLVTNLTPRQLEVLHLLDHGSFHAADRRAARDLDRDGPQPHPRVLRTLGVHSRLQAVAEARKRGLVAS